MRLALTTFFLFTSVLQLYSQSWQWAREISNTQGQYPYGIDQHENGDIYISQGANTITRFNSEGVFEWDTVITSMTKINDIKVTQNRIYLAGENNTTGNYLILDLNGNYVGSNNTVSECYRISTIDSLDIAFIGELNGTIRKKALQEDGCLFKRLIQVQ